MDNLYVRNKEIVVLKKEGYSYAYIGRKYDLSKKQVRKICFEYGVNGPAKILVVRSKIGDVEQKSLF